MTLQKNSAKTGIELCLNLVLLHPSETGHTTKKRQMLNEIDTSLPWDTICVIITWSILPSHEHSRVFQVDKDVIDVSNDKYKLVHAIKHLI